MVHPTNLRGIFCYCLALIALFGLVPPALAEEGDLVGYSVYGKYLAPGEADMFRGAVKDYYAGVAAFNSGNYSEAERLCVRSMRMLDHLGIPDEGDLAKLRRGLKECVGDAQWFGGSRMQACQTYASYGYATGRRESAIDACAAFQTDQRRLRWNAFIDKYQTFNTRLAALNGLPQKSPERANAARSLKENCEQLRLQSQEFSLAMAVTWFCHGITSAELSTASAACRNWFNGMKKLDEATRRPADGVLAEGWVTTLKAVTAAYDGIPEMCAGAGYPFPGLSEKWPHPG